MNKLPLMAIFDPKKCARALSASGKCDENGVPLGCEKLAILPTNSRDTFQNPPFIFPLGNCETIEINEINLISWPPGSVRPKPAILRPSLGLMVILPK